MDSRTRLLTAWSFKEPDRVPVELVLAPCARDWPEARRIREFAETQADNFPELSVAQWGFLGVQSKGRTEIIEDVPGAYHRDEHIHQTAAGEFRAVTRHNYDELNPADYHWEKRYFRTVEDMERFASAPVTPIQLDKKKFDDEVARIGGRGLPVVMLLHPLGSIVRCAELEEVFGWFLTEPRIMHRVAERGTEMLLATVEAMAQAGIGPRFYQIAHEMLLPPWMGRKLFEEYVFPYDKAVYDAIHRFGGKIRTHCHGNCMAYLERFSEMGVDSIEPLEPPPFADVDLAEAKRRVGGRMLLSGNVPSQAFLRMSLEEVRQCVREAIRIGAPGGGFTLRTTGGAPGCDAKSRRQVLDILPRVQAYIDAALEFGAYPIHIKR